MKKVTVTLRSGETYVFEGVECDYDHKHDAHIVRRGLEIILFARSDGLELFLVEENS